MLHVPGRRLSDELCDTVATRAQELAQDGATYGPDADDIRDLAEQAEELPDAAFYDGVLLSLTREQHEAEARTYAEIGHQAPETVPDISLGVHLAADHLTALHRALALQAELTVRGGPVVGTVRLGGLLGPVAVRIGDTSGGRYLIEVPSYREAARRPEEHRYPVRFWQHGRQEAAETVAAVIAAPDACASDLADAIAQTNA